MRTSVETVGEDLSRATALLLDEATRMNGIVLGAEILDLPDRGEPVRAAKAGVSAILSRLISIEDLNANLPVLRHRDGGEIVYRNRRTNLELRYPEAAEVLEDEWGLETGSSMLQVALGGFPPVVFRAMAGAAGGRPFEDFAASTVALAERASGGALSRMKHPAIHGARHYLFDYPIEGRAYREDLLLFEDGATGTHYALEFMAPVDRREAAVPQFADLIAGLKPGKPAPLRYRTL